jgi:hypothetical protein
MGKRAQKSLFEFRKKHDMFVSSETSRTPLGTTDAAVQ